MVFVLVQVIKFGRQRKRFVKSYRYTVRGEGGRERKRGRQRETERDRERQRDAISCSSNTARQPQRKRFVRPYRYSYSQGREKKDLLAAVVVVHVVELSSQRKPCVRLRNKPKGRKERK